MKRILYLIAAFTLIILLTGCADTHDIIIPNDPAGFWAGLWHGFIIVWSWIGSLIWDDIAIYEIYNNGGWYDFGFFFGVGGFGRLVNGLFGNDSK